MTSKDLAKPGDRPLSIVHGPTASQQDKIEYRKNELDRLQTVIEDLKITREDLTQQLASAENFRDYLSLECPTDLTRKMTIIECTEKRKRQECLKKNCIPRTRLLSKINL